MPMIPQAVVSYNRTVTDLRSIHCTAAGMESTSLVVAVGLDVFFTQVAPSKPFDVLKEDFNYALLMLLIGGLMVFTFFANAMVKRKELGSQWR